MTKSPITKHDLSLVKKSPAILFVITCLGIGCAAKPGTTYDSDLLKQNVRFIPPVGWRRTRDAIRPPVLVKVTFAFLDRGPIVSTDGRKFPEAIMSFGVIESSKNEYEQQLSTVQENKEQVNLAGVPGYFWFTEGEPQAVKAQGVKVTRKTYTFFKDNKMYLLVYSAYSSALAEKENFEV